jgi:hypothetical protein
MSIPFWYWIFLALLFFLGVHGGYTRRSEGPLVWGGLIPFVLFLLIGWAVFGAPVSGG